jgi:hypothetical protein
LQDFLDGRLSERERAEMEALLEEDVELARRVEAWREIGHTLRQDEGELPPGFYARARERFEQTARARPPWGFRLLSWEAAGLAAAVVLAAVLFVPEVMRNPDLPTGSPSTVESSADEVRADRPAPPEPAARDKRRAPEALGKAKGPDDAAQVVDDRMKAQAPLEEDVTHAEGLRERDAAEPEPEWAPVPPEAAAPEVDRERLEAEKRALTVLPPTAPGRGRREPTATTEAELAEEPQPTPVHEKKGERAAKAAAPTEALSRSDVSADLEGFAAQAVDVPVVELPADAPIDDGIRIVDHPADWETWLAGPAGPALSNLGGYEAGRRLVLVGRSGGVDCASLTVRRDERGYRVRLAHAGASAGCALLLPRDGLPIALDAAPGE